MIYTPRDLLEYLREEKQDLEKLCRLTTTQRARLAHLREIWKKIDWDALRENEDFKDIKEVR